jgi:hypothetical protein
MQTDQDAELRKAALKHIQAKRGFLIHAITYVVINALIVAVWAFADSGGLFWPIFPILGWGVGLILHGVMVYKGQPSESEIEREMARLRR